MVGVLVFVFERRVWVGQGMGLRLKEGLWMD